MSESESFIEEVSEELRRDRLFAFFRRWAWLAILVVLVVVGLAAWNEWNKARMRAEAEALGDRIVAALGQGDATARALALDEIGADGATRALVDMLVAAEVGDDAEAAAAIDTLGAGGADEGVAPRWRDLAALKLILLEADTTAPADRIARLEPLSASNAPYRLLALEQIAYARIEAGERDIALGVLRDILADDAATEGLRLRAGQMIVALGGEVDPA